VLVTEDTQKLELVVKQSIHIKVPWKFNRLQI